MKLKNKEVVTNTIIGQIYFTFTTYVTHKSLLKYKSFTSIKHHGVVHEPCSVK